MTIEYLDAAHPAVLRQLPRLFEDVGWKRRTTTDLGLALARSDADVFAVQGDRLVGFGRRFSDGVYYAWIVDLIVAPALQRRGVGRTILAQLARGRATTCLSHVASDDVAAFYRRLGWHPADSLCLCIAR